MVSFRSQQAVKADIVAERKKFLKRHRRKAHCQDILFTSVRIITADFHMKAVSADLRNMLRSMSAADEPNAFAGHLCTDGFRHTKSSQQALSCFLVCFY